jgi:hypothetical protein
MKSTGILTETLVTINSKKKTASKLDEKKNSCVYIPFHVKNGNSYIITLNIFMKGIYPRNSIKKKK